MGTIVSVPQPTGTIVSSSGIDFNSRTMTSVPAYREVTGYRERWSATEQESIRVFDVSWNARKFFVNTLLGYATNVNGNLVRQIPAQHPEYPWQYAVSVELIDCLGAMGQNGLALITGDPNSSMVAYYDNSDPTGNTPGKARYAVRYRPLPFEVYDETEKTLNPNITELQRFVERSEIYAMSALPIPGGGTTGQLNFVGGPQNNQPINQTSVNKLMPTKEVTYVWHMIPDIPETALKNTQGKVNSTTFDDQVTLASGTKVGGIPGGYAPGTLLMLAPAKERINRGIDGHVMWRLIIKMLYREQGHNYFPADNGLFYLASRDGTNSTANGNLLYDSTEFADVFKMPNPQNYYQSAGG